MPELKILFATSEVAPLIKTGGLADVSGALPPALRDIGIDVHVLVPGYNQVMEKMSQLRVAATFDNMTGFPSSRLLTGEMKNGVPLYVLDCPELYRRAGGPYQDTLGVDWPDNAIRFGLFSRVAALLGSKSSSLNWYPDLVHCNDWQTGLTPAYLQFEQGTAKSIMCIHNLAFQGIFPSVTVSQLQLPPSCFSIEGVEFYGNMSFLKAGLYYTDHITTVSPNYAKEIQHEKMGSGLQGLLAARSNRLSGILNGIDTEEWNPATDHFLAKTYIATDMAGKSENKAFLQRRMGLKTSPEIPLLGVVGRFTHQKGLDTLLEIVPLLIKLPVQLAILGTGDAKLQDAARELSRRYPEQIGVSVGFSEELSHQIEAGADMFVMPSRFEPCGLNQMYSQRYGTPPIVHATGGLADSVIDCTPETIKKGTASGFMFSGMTAENLYSTIQRAVNVYKDITHWNKLRLICMGKDFSWEKSAKAYRDVYLRVLSGSH